MQTIMKLTGIRLTLFAVFCIFGGCLNVEPGLEPEPGQATDPTPETTAISSDLDATANAGSVEIPLSKTFDVSPATVKNVGGGTWNYGRSGNHCWSHYVHPNKRHSATAIMGPDNIKKYANAGTWANADVVRLTIATCSAYWNTY